MTTTEIRVSPPTFDEQEFARYRDQAESLSGSAAEIVAANPTMAIVFLRRAQIAATLANAHAVRAQTDLLDEALSNLRQAVL